MEVFASILVGYLWGQYNNRKSIKNIEQLGGVEAYSKKQLWGKYKDFRHRLDPIYSLDIDSTGKILASSDNNTIILWDIDKGEKIDILKNHNDRVYTISFHPTKNILASGSLDRTVKLWDIDKMEEIDTLRGHKMPVFSVAFHPTKNILASGSYDKTIKLWDIENRKKLSTLKGHNNLTELAFHPNKNILASGSDKEVILWNVEDGKEIYRIDCDNEIIRDLLSLVFDKRGNLFIAFEHMVKYFNMKTQKLTIFRESDNEITYMTYNSTKDYLAIADYNKILIYDYTYKYKFIINIFDDDDYNDNLEIYSMVFDPTGKILACGFNNGSIRLWKNYEIYTEDMNMIMSPITDYPEL